MNISPLNSLSNFVFHFIKRLDLAISGYPRKAGVFEILMKTELYDEDGKTSHSYVRKVSQMELRLANGQK